MSIEKNSKKYDDNAIQTLSSLEHIRLRTGMYIGKQGDGSNYDDGIYILLKEVVDNSVDEFMEGNGKKIEITLDGNSLSCRDYGRGIPLNSLVKCVSNINTGGKFNNEIFQYSAGLNGVGLKAVNALSISFIAKSYREGKYKEVEYKEGKIVNEVDGDTTEKNGTYIQFLPDDKIFKNYKYNIGYIKKRLWYYAYLNKNLKIVINGETISSKNGLLDLLNEEVDNPLYEPIYYTSQKLEFVFTHVPVYGENHYSFVNGQYTSDGGTHLSAFREAILKAVNEFFKKQYDGKDVRDGIAGAVAIKILDPIFESQTKNKLGNSDIKSWIINESKKFLVDFFYKNPEIAEKIEEKIQLNEKIRKELKSVQKEARELAKKTSIRIPKLRDCKHHLNDVVSPRKRAKWRGEESMIFLTEGDSAAGSMVNCRDSETQAIFALRGKPLNVLGLKRDQLYKNEEFFNIIKALNIEDGIENLRYSKVVIATDSDPDGLHIRNLLMTFFLHYYEKLVLNGSVYILETPLFRVRNSKKTIYCYDENEKDVAIKELKGKPEITRFKGLGEISPNEFKQFINEDIRLVQVNIDKRKEILSTLEFYMGKNTPDRKNYIMENLDRAEVE
ncbi:MAG: DNA topoisomerase IV [Candidatus Cloacimonadota bacterium]|nr:MAG: DNA topoisomerase IV [Candidatus Cloacimonadota bacterium]PIE79947.1 MAG: DNA topoisomerase IV [Candidatus Delongbacteria bacterium]